MNVKNVFPCEAVEKSAAITVAPIIGLDYKKAFPAYTVGTIDTEVFKNWWCVVLSNADGMHVFRSDCRFDSSKLKRFLNNHDFIMGYNIIGFDAPILMMIADGCSTAKIYEATQMIIEQHKSWFEVLHKFLPDNPRIDFGVVELIPMRDPAGGESVALKHIQAITGHEIVECRIAFDKDDLTNDDKEEIIRYCKNDVTFTESVIYPARAAAVETDIHLSKMCQKADGKDWRHHLIKSSNSKSAIVLGVNDTDYSADEFDLYDHIVSLAKRFCPEKTEYKKVYKWFATEAAKLNLLARGGLDDIKAIRAQVRKTKLEIPIDNGLKMVFGMGGQHGAFERYIHAENVYDTDVSSMYPNIMSEYGLCSRRMRFPEKIKQMTDDRVRLKNSPNLSDKQTADAYKQVLVSIFGAMGNYGGQLYDPRNLRAVCITGQLALLKLIEMLEPHCYLINTNTDGIFWTPKDGADMNNVIDIHEKWQQITGLNLEINGTNREPNGDGHCWANAKPFVAMYQFNVNNYHLVKSEGKSSDKGSATSMVAGQFSRGSIKLEKYDGRIIKKAIVAYLTNRTPVADFVRNGEDFRDFMFVAKSNTQVYQDEQEIADHNLRFALVKDGGSTFTKHTKKSRASIPNATSAKLFHENLNDLSAETHKKLIGTLDLDRYVYLAERALERLLNDKTDYSGSFEKFLNIYPKWSARRDNGNFPVHPTSDPWSWEHHDGSLPACMLPDGYVWGVDIDDCIYDTIDDALNDPKHKARNFKPSDFVELITGKFINKTLLIWLKRLDTYTELSDSGHGIHCIVLADCTDLNCKKGSPFINGFNIELFNSSQGNHAITITGKHLFMFPNNIKSKTMMIKALLKTLPDRAESDAIDSIKATTLNATQKQLLWINAIHVAVCRVQDEEQPEHRYIASRDMIWKLRKNGYSGQEIIAAAHKLWDEVCYWSAEHAVNRENLLKGVK